MYRTNFTRNVATQMKWNFDARTLHFQPDSSGFFVVVVVSGPTVIRNKDDPY